MDDSTATIPQAGPVKPEEPAPQTKVGSAIELEPDITYKGNQTDILALVTLISTIFAGVTCGTCGWGFCCVPLVTVILGIIGLSTSKKSLDPRRTKTYSWIGIGVGGFFTFIILCVMLLYILYFVVVFGLLIMSPESFSSNVVFS